MNDTTIEKFLTQAPRPKAPPGLLQDIQKEIALSWAKPSSRSRDWQQLLRRWLPATAFSVWMLSCAIVMAMQANWTTNLKRENDALRATAADLTQLRERHAAFEQAQANQEELVQLKKDNEELHSLQKEVGQLQNLPAQIQQLQDDNKRLAAAQAANSNTTSGAQFFEDAEAEAERIQCVNNLKQIGLAMRIWMGDNHDKYPASILLASNILSTTMVLVCPSDKARLPYAKLGFGKFQEDMTSYKFTVKPDEEDDFYPECIVARCPIHHNYLLADGSVQQINPEKFTEVQKDGRWYLQNIQTGGGFRDAIVQPIK